MPDAHTPIEVFCSYAHQDEEHLQKLKVHLSGLERQGLISVWYDRHIPIGTDWAQAIDTHLETASLILLLITANFLHSDYCYKTELPRAMQRHEANLARLFPIIVSPCDWSHTPFAHLQSLPRDGKPITTWENQEGAWHEVAAGIRRAIEELPAPSASTPQSAGPSVWNIPYPRNPVFTGREQILTDLATALKTSQATALSQAQAISGLGGIGKTQIAVEYAYRSRQDYQAVFWVLSDTRDSLVSGYIALAGLLNLPEKDAQDQQVTIGSVIRWLQTHDSWLLILDNADDLVLAYEFLPPTFGGHLLITTRAQATGTRAQRLEVETMLPEVGTLFLLRRAKLIAQKGTLADVPEASVATARSICEELGGLPLALDQAGAYIEEVQCSLSDYQQRYRTRRTRLLKRRGGLVADHPEPVATTWSLSFEKVEQKSPIAADLLRLCAWLHPDAIPVELITKAASHLGPTLAVVGEDDVALDEAIATLGTYSLIRRDVQKKTLSVHRLVQAVLKDTMGDKMGHVWAERTVRAVNAVFPDVDFKTWPECERYLSHALVCAELVQQKQISSPEAAELLRQAGWYLTERARYREAQQLLERAYQISQEARGETHLDTARDAHALAYLYQAQGKYSEAEELYQRALGIKEQALGPEHPSTAATLHELARLYQKQGKYREAEPLYQRALGIDEQALGPEHPSTATTLHMLAYVYQEQGKYREAESLCQRALGIKEQALGPDHPSTGDTLHALAYVYQEQGKYREAESLYQRVLAICEQALGLEHPSTGETLHELARLYQKQGKYKEAEPLYQRALAIYEQALGPDHPYTATTLHALARLYQNQGKYSEAEPLYQRALTIRERVLGPDHPRTKALHEGYASLLQEMGRKKPDRDASPPS